MKFLEPAELLFESETLLFSIRIKKKTNSRVRFCFDFIIKRFTRIYLSREEEEEEEEDKSNDTWWSRVPGVAVVFLFLTRRKTTLSKNETSDEAFPDDGKEDEEASHPFDLSSYDRLEIESIEKTFNLELNSIDPNVIEMAVKRAKELANMYFKSGEYEKSAEQYTTAIAGARGRIRRCGVIERRHGCRSGRDWKRYTIR